MSIEENGEATLISYTASNDFFKGKIKTFTAIQFISELTQHIPPKACQYIRRYGLYASRTKGRWPEKPHVLRLAPEGWKKEHLKASEPAQPYPEESAYSVSDKESRCTWARLIAQVYEGCAPRCPSGVSALPLTHEGDCRDHRARRGAEDFSPLAKIGRSPPGLGVAVAHHHGRPHFV